MARPRKNPTPNTVAKSAPVEAVKETVAVKAEPAAEKPVEAPKPEAKAEASKPVKKTRTRTASKKTEKPEVKAETKKSTAKSRKAEAPAPKKRAPRKPKTITVDDVVAKISKRIDTTAAAALVPQGKAAVDIKLWGAFEAHMYIEIKDGTVNVAPYDYIEKDLEAAVPVDVALAIADGKTTVQAAVENGSLYVFGNVQFALMFAKLFK
ncbi:MAG: SCP2 sterol-binding domain-containing protein [Oscillospiraceae bacterium]